MNPDDRTLTKDELDQLPFDFKDAYYAAPDSTDTQYYFAKWHGVTNLFVTDARDCENTRDRENAYDQVAPTSHVTVGTHVTYNVTSGPLGYHMTYHDSSRDPA